jgi:hypothetical protein
MQKEKPCCRVGTSPGRQRDSRDKVAIIIVIVVIIIAACCQV